MPALLLWSSTWLRAERLLHTVQKAVSAVKTVSEKALYAISSLIRNNHAGQTQFYEVRLSGILFCSPPTLVSVELLTAVP